jgi:hypothetical protein
VAVDGALAPKLVAELGATLEIFKVHLGVRDELERAGWSDHLPGVSLLIRFMV